MKIINYKGQQHQVRNITDSKGNIYSISTESLQEQLSADNYSDLAGEIDDALIGYIPNDKITLNNEDLIAYCKEIGMIE